MGKEVIESLEQVLEIMNEHDMGSTLQRIKDVYGLNGQRLRGIVVEFDPTVIEETQADLDRRYPDLRHASWTLPE